MKDFFCGWYFKCQSPEQTLAVIPAFHKGKEGKSCSIQLITEEGAWNVKFPYDCFQKGKKELSLKIGKNYFGADGIRLAIKGNRFSAIGEVRFGALSPIWYDIMGPFQYLPLMECRHSVFSMRFRFRRTANQRHALSIPKWRRLYRRGPWLFFSQAIRLDTVLF